MPNMLAGLYNARGFTLTFGTGNKALRTGVASFRMHFSSLSTRLGNNTQGTAYGASASFRAVCNRGLAIKAGDVLVLMDILGESQNGRRFRVDGVQDYPHQFGLLDHMNLSLTEFVQN
jgi:hypothetical protein